MAFFLGVVRALLISLLVSAALADGNKSGNDDKKCGKPKVRREWRKLSPSERGDWIKAMNVLFDFPFYRFVKALTVDCLVYWQGSS
jgi:hypothetical protein